MFRLVTICVILHITIGALATDSTSETWEFKLSEGASWLVSGRAMFRTNSTEEWGYVCSDEFKENDYGPLAFCHSLGLLGITQARFIPAPRTVLDHPILLDDVTCLENATFIQNCTHNPIGIHNCLDGGNELSGVECTIPPEYWEFRLVGGIGVEGNSTPTNGRVEMRPLPSLPWGSVNNALFKRGSGYDTAALKAVCTTLGFNVTGILPVAIDVPYYSTGPSYLNPRYCYEGSDPYLQNCTMYILASSTWGATSQLAVECAPAWEFQLVNDVTPNPWEGRVIGRISKAMNFSRVCSDVLYTDALYSLCRSSGMTDAYYARKMPLGTYGLDPTIESESPYILSSLECTNPFSDVEKCKFNPLFSLNCGADGQLNLRCPPFNASEWQFRLRNTTSVATRGYFEINPYESIGEPWMYLTNCISASLACRQVGFSNWSYPPSVTYASPQSGMGSVGFMMSPSCSGNTFDTCRLNQGYYLRSYRYAGCYYRAAYLDCNTTKPPDPYVDFPALWQFRMVTNAPEYNGSVLVNDTYHVNGTWTESYITREAIQSGVCDEDWFEFDTNCSGTLSPGKVLLTVYSSVGDWVGGETTTTSTVDGVCLNGTWTSGNCTGTWNESETFYACNGTVNGSDCINGTWEVSSVVTQSTVPGVCVNGSWVEGACANNGTWESSNTVGEEWEPCYPTEGTSVNSSIVPGVCINGTFENGNCTGEWNFTAVLVPSVCNGTLVNDTCVNGTWSIEELQTSTSINGTCFEGEWRLGACTGVFLDNVTTNIVWNPCFGGVPITTSTVDGVCLNGTWTSGNCTGTWNESETFYACNGTVNGSDCINGTWEVSSVVTQSTVPGVCVNGSWVEGACANNGTWISVEYVGRTCTSNSSTGTSSTNMCGVKEVDHYIIQNTTVLGPEYVAPQYVNGTALIKPRSGRVEMRMTPKDPWLRISYSSSETTRRAVCRVLNFTDVEYVPNISPSKYGVGVGNFSLTGVSCDYRNPNTDVRYCSHSMPPTTVCASCTDMTVECEPYAPQYRLYGGTRDTNGRFQMKPYNSSDWTGVCSYSFNQEDADAACHQLGYHTSEKSFEYRDWTLGSVSRILSDPDCGGEYAYETCSLRYALGDYYSCTTDVGLECDPLVLNSSLFEYRLVNGTTSREGRVEMRFNSSFNWERVCYPTSYTYEARISACWSVGIMDTRWAPGVSATAYGPGNDTVLWAQTSLYCYSKSYLNECSFAKPVYTYGCSQGDFAVTCPTFEPEYRLVTFEREDAGRLEFRPHPTASWGNIYNGIFSQDEIAVACRHFGFNESLDVQQTFTFPAPTQTTYLYSLNCHPNGTNLADNCTYPSRMSDTRSYWTSRASLGLDCNPKKWRLNPSTGTTAGAGRIEYRPTVLSAWGTVCNDGFKTSHTAWLAACRSVGWTNVTSAKPVYYGAGTGTIYIDDISCPIGAMYLEQCSHSPVGVSNCAHVEDSGVDCFAPVDVPDAWQFRLSGGTAGSNGRLEVKPDATSPWGTICQDTFNYSYTTWLTACQTVGYPTSRAEFKRYPNLGSPVFLDHIDCKPNSTHLSNCSMFPLGSFGCAQSDMAGIDCNPQVILPEVWEFRFLPMIPHENATIDVSINCSNASLTNNVTGCNCTIVVVGGVSTVQCNATVVAKPKVYTATYRKGVQVGGLLQFRPKPTNEWGFVCNGSKTITQAFVEAACRSIGLEPSFALLSHDYGNGFGYDYLSDPECSESDMYLQNCTFAQLYVNDCDHTTDIALECVLPTPSGTFTQSGNTVTVSEELPITDSVSMSVSLTDTHRLYMGRPPSSALASFPPLLAGPVMALLAVVGTPIEVQIFIVLLMGPCASVGDHESARVMSYFLSPFISLGDAVAAIGNVILGLLFFAGHLLFAVVAHRLQGRLWNKQPVVKYDAASKYEQDNLAQDTSVDSLQKGGGIITHYTYREVLALSCFPGIPLFACRVLLTGVALFGNLSLIRGMGAPATNAEEEDLDGMTDKYLMLSAGVIGILFQIGVVSAFAVSLWAARRGEVYDNGSVGLPNVTYVSYIWSQTRVPGWLHWICPRGRWISTPAPRLDDSISSVVEPPFPYSHRTITGVATASHGRYFFSGMIPVVVAVVLGGIPFGFLHTAWTDGYIEEKNPYIIRDPTITSTTTTVAYCGYLYLLPAVGMVVIGALYGGMRLSRSIVQSILTAACYVVVGGFAITQGILRIDEGLATEELGRIKSILGYVLMFLVIVRLIHTLIVFLIEHCTTSHTALVYEEESIPSHGPSDSTTESALDEASEEEPVDDTPTPENFADIKQVNTPHSDKLIPASSPNDQPLVSVVEEDGIVILDVDSLANSRSYTLHPSRRPSLLSVAGANRTISGGLVFGNTMSGMTFRTMSRQSGTAGRTLTPGNTVHRVATPNDWGSRIESDINNIAPAQRDPPTVARVWAQLQSAVREGHVAALSEPSSPAPLNDVVVDDYSDEEPAKSPTLQVPTQGWAALKKRVLPSGKQQNSHKKWKF